MADSKSNSKLRKILIIRGIFNFLSVIMIIFAYLGFSWGEYLSPVQRSGVAVSFVFDISNSMTVKDCPQNTTRLEAASIYSRKLLEKMEGVSTSVVLAKGDGIVAIPLTEDFALIESLLDVLSPKLMTVPGTSLGKGILAAKNSFPQNFSRAGRIFVFTDGEETDGELVNALEECIKTGIPVSIIGFGSEKESDLVLADKSTVKTALRSKKIAETIETVNLKTRKSKVQGNISYIDSNERGSASNLLKLLSTANSSTAVTNVNTNSNANNDKILSYETKPVPRYKFFLLMAILLFATGYLITEFDFNGFYRKARKLSPVLLCFIFLGCSNDTFTIFEGTIAWHKKEYKKAVASFRNVADSEKAEEKTFIRDYALYNLGSAYSMVNEEEAALEQFAKISSDSNKNIQYAAFYNTGVILFKNGKYEKAKEYFRKAIEADSSRIEAKINMELSMKKVQTEVKQSQSNTIPAAEKQEHQPEMEDALFQHIKENDQKQWKNSESSQNTDYSNDY